MKQNKQFFRRLLAVAFWLAVWQAAAMAIGQEVFLVSPVQALRTLVQLLPRADFWQRVGFSSGRILLGFVLGTVVSVVLAVCAAWWSAADALLAPVMQLVKATPVASFIILALVWVRGHRFRCSSAFNGAARAVRCGAHRHPERRPTAVGDDEGVSPSAGPTAAGGVAACGAAGLPAGMQRGPWHLLEERRCR